MRHHTPSKEIGFRPIRLVLLLVTGMAILGGFGGRSYVHAAVPEVLVPRPNSQLLARHPETHLILRGQYGGKPLTVRANQDGNVWPPRVVEEGEDGVYFHFRLPLKPGENVFTLLPVGREISFSYKRLQADFSSRLVGKETFLFHQQQNLPESCAQCHSLDSIAQLSPLGLEKQVSCRECHQRVLERGHWKHAPTTNQQCMSCHQVGEDSWNIGFPDARIQEVCFACHTTKSNWLEGRHVHGVLELGGCSLCHDPHGGKHRYQLWAEGSLELCIACHGEKRDLVREEDPVPYVHGIIFGKGCTVCHSPHASDSEFMLYQPVNQLCFSCHPYERSFQMGHPVPGHPVSTAKFGPARKLNCASCHDPHGSQHPKMLIQTKRGALLCKECHDR